MKNILFAVLLLPLCVQAQGVIKGTLVDEKGDEIPFGNVSVFNRSDSLLVAGVPSDENGTFRIAVQNGIYYLVVSIISFKEHRVNGLRVQQNEIDVGRIRLVPDVMALEEVIVQGERSQMQLDLDKRVFNVGSDLTSLGGSASDILNNVPSVTVDAEGVVSLRGSENVRILIDGRASGLTGISSPDALRLLQGDMIDRIEVITNPSSRYDAEGEVGIINIILKKNQRQGFNGAFSVNMGYPATYGASFDLSYRRERLNLFSSYGYNFRTNKGFGSSYQLFETPDSVFSYRESNTRTRSGGSHILRAGADYSLTDQDVLSAAIMYRTGRGKNSSRYSFEDYDAEGNLFQSSVRSEEEREPRNNIEASLAYRKEFEQKGRSFMADIRLINSQELEMADFRQTQPGAANDLLQRSSNTEDERNIQFQADYVHPFGDKGKWEAGWKSTYRRLDNDFGVEERGESGNWALLPQYDNYLVYKEGIHAGYAMAGSQFGKFSMQAGLRGEFSDITTELPRLGDHNRRTYFNLFPSVHLSFQFDESRSVQLSYSRRLSRPGFRSLLPFSGFSNNRSLRMGNPDLDPEYTNSLEAGHLFNWDNGSLLGSVYYRYRTGVIQHITLVDSIGFNRSYPINLASQNAYGVELNSSMTFWDWWKVNGNFNFYRAITDGVYENKTYGSDTYTWIGRVTSKMTIDKKWDFQAGMNYRGAQITLQGRRLPSYTIDLGLARDLFKGNGTVIVSVQDLFQTGRWRNIIDEPGFYSSSDGMWRGRQFRVTLNYRLNRKKSSKDALDERGGGDMEGEN